MHKLERGLSPNSLVPKLREEVNRWQVSGVCVSGTRTEVSVGLSACSCFFWSSQVTSGLVSELLAAPV